MPQYSFYNFEHEGYRPFGPVGWGSKAAVSSLKISNTFGTWFTITLMNPRQCVIFWIHVQILFLDSNIFIQWVCSVWTRESWITCFCTQKTCWAIFSGILFKELVNITAIISLMSEAKEEYCTGWLRCYITLFFCWITVISWQKHQQ